MAKLSNNTTDLSFEVVVDVTETPQTIDLVLAAQLQGYPKQFEKEFTPALKFLVSQGIAAEVDDGFMRGYKFHEFIQ